MKIKLLFLALILAISGGSLCGQINNAGGGSGGVTSNTFYIATSCSGLAQCLQWKDDNSTDNCGAATTSFLATINAYSGSAPPVLWIQGGAGGAGTGFKLATAGCHLEFDIPITIHLWALLNCAQPATTANCIQFGATGLVATAHFAASFMDGGGSITGCVNLTTACIEVEPFTDNTMISQIQFINAGAGNGTLGNCTNWAIQHDSPINEATVSGTQWDITDSTAGRCAYNNSGGASTGFNTVNWNNNVIGGEGSSTATCSSVGINENGSYGSITGNNIFGFKDGPIVLAGIGTYVGYNQLDTGTGTSCAGTTLIQWGGAGSNAVVGDFTIEGNKMGGNPNGSTTLFGKNLIAGASASLRSTTLIGNINSKTSGATTAAALTDGSACTVNASAGPCYALANQNISPTNTIPSGSNSSGWVVGVLAGQIPSQTGKTANLTSTLLASAPVVAGYYVNCEVVITTAATTSSTLPQCQVTFTDAFSSVAQTITITPTWASGTPGCNGSATNAVGNSCMGQVLIVPSAAGQNINIQTINYASVGGTPMAYTLFANLVKASQ